MRKLIALSFVLAACGRPPEVDPFLAPHLASFHSEAQARRVYVDVSQIDANFSDELPHWMVARCHEGKIEFNITYWYAHSDSEREAFIFNELAECVLQKRDPLFLFGYMENRSQSLDRLFLR